MAYSRPSKKKNTTPYGNVDVGLAERTTGRLNALGGQLKGVNVADGISRKEAQAVKYARRKQKAQRIGQRAYKRYRNAQKPKPTVTPTEPTNRAGDHG